MTKLTPPKIHEVSKIELRTPVIKQLDNGIPVFDSRIGQEDVLKIQIVFDNGRPFERKLLASRITSKLIKEGTRKYSGKQIAETFDYYGATLRLATNLDESRVTIFTLKKHFDQLLPLLTEMLTVPTFPQDEFKNFIDRCKQRLAVDLSKNDTVAYRVVTEKIFGVSHFYGYNSNLEMFDSITRDDIVEHFQKTFGSNNCKIFISGKTDDSIVEKLNRTLGKVLKPIPDFDKEAKAIPKVEKRVIVPMKGSLQSAIRIGRHLYNRHHPDYTGMFVLSTIFGGYFGSRLMSVIREEKGYTYNISCSLDSFRRDGCFHIGTEVSPEFVEPTIKCIYEEMDKLKNELVGADELKMVRRYLLGNMLQQLDGAFNTSDVVRSLTMEKIPLENFEKMVKIVKNITAEEIRDLAQKLFVKEKMWEVVVG